MAQWDITKKGTEFQFAASTTAWVDGDYFPVDVNHILTVSADLAGAGNLKARILEINPSTFAITATISEQSLSSDIVGAGACSAARLDDTHFILSWTSDSPVKVYTRVISVDVSTYAITQESTTTTISSDPNFAGGARLSEIDDENTLITYNRNDGNGTGTYELASEIVTTNTSTWKTTGGTPTILGGVTGFSNYLASVAKVDSTHYIIVFYDTVPNIKAGVVTIDTGAGTVTITDSFVTISAGNLRHSVEMLTSTRGVVCYYDNTDTIAETIDLDGSYAITTTGTTYTIDATAADDTSVIRVTGDHALICYDDASSTDGKSIVVSVDSGTGNIAAEGTPVQYNASVTANVEVYKYDLNHFIVISNSGTNGEAVVLEIEDVPEPFKPKISFS